MTFHGLTQEEYRKLLKTINGALQSCIRIHGPIRSDQAGSASKRILGALKTFEKDQKND